MRRWILCRSTAEDVYKRQEYIRALITEEGILPPYALFHVAMEYAKSLEGL